MSRRGPGDGRFPKKEAMSFSNLDAVLFTAGFLVPGFVWAAVLSMLLPRRAAGSEIRLLEYLTLSCVNYGLWSWAIIWIYKSGLINEHPYWSGVVAFGIISVSPLALGLTAARLQQKDAVGAFLRSLGFRTISPVPTAWDWTFGRLKPCWVLATLKKRSRIHGLFGEKSFAGDDPQCRDLYLEATYRPVSTGDWAPMEDTAGVLIMADQIASLEFRMLEGVQYEE